MGNWVDAVSTAFAYTRHSEQDAVCSSGAALFLTKLRVQGPSTFKSKSVCQLEKHAKSWLGAHSWDWWWGGGMEVGGDGLLGLSVCRLVGGLVGGSGCVCMCECC